MVQFEKSLIMLCGLVGTSPVTSLAKQATTDGAVCSHQAEYATLMTNTAQPYGSDGIVHETFDL